MQTAMVGLGRMGMNMAKRLLRDGHQIIAYNRTPSKTDEIAQEGAVGAYSLDEVIQGLTPPRVAWLMLPAGPPVDDLIQRISRRLDPGDVIIDGGNSFYKDAVQRAQDLSARGIHFVDVGVSGGIWGLEQGYCLMVGGPKETYPLLEPLFQTLAPPKGYLYCGPAGAGHFVKMVHNGIEYAMMQAYGEGFDLLQSSPYSEWLNPGDIAHLWNQGSVVRSWLLELTEAAFARDERLSKISGYVEDSGEGRWTVQQAIESGVATPVIALSLMRRFSSRKKDAFADRLIAALRREFGGHTVLPEGNED